MTIDQQTYSPEAPAYFELDSDANVLPLDPVTGNRLRAGEIPESLLADPELRKGYDYLRNNGSRIQLTLLLSPHKTSEDLIKSGINLAAEAKELAEHHGVLFLEGTYASSAGKERDVDMINMLSHLPGAQAGQMQRALRFSQDGTSFQAESIAQIIGSNVEVACPDYVLDSDRPADKALAEWKMQLRIMEEREQLVSGDFDRYNSLLTGFTLYRDWYLVGKIGAYLAGRPEYPSDEADNAIHGKLVAGSTHPGVGKYIEGFGASVEYVGETSDKLSRQNARIVQAAGAAMLTLTVRVEQLADITLSAKR